MAARQIRTPTPYGVSRDLSAHLAGENVWNEAFGVTFQRNRTLQADGYQYHSPDPLYPPEQIYYRDLDGQNQWFYTGPSNIGLNIGNATYNVTPAAWVSAHSSGLGTWTGLNSVPVFNHPERVPVSHGGDPNVVMTPLPNWPAGWSCRAMRAFKYHLFALDVKDGVDRYENQMRWSSSANAGNVPSDWVKDAANDAGELTLSETPGEILDAMALGGKFYVYKPYSTYVVTYLGGVLVYAQRLVFSSLGILGRNCVGSFNNRHFVVTKGDVIVHDGVHVESVAEKWVRRAIFDTIDPTQTYKAFVVHDTRGQRMLFFWPDAVATNWCNWRAAFNYRDVRWEIERIGPDEVAAAAPGAYTVTGSTQTWADAAGLTWATDVGRWSDDAADVVGVGEQLMLGLPAATKLGEVLPGHGRAGNPISSSMSWLSKDLGDPDYVKLLETISIEGGKTGGLSFRVYVGSQDDPDSATIWSGPFVASSNGQKPMTVQPLVKGRFLSVRLEIDTTEGWWVDRLRLTSRRCGRYS